MTHEELVAEGSHLTKWERHRFFLLVALTILVSLFLVGVSLAMYATSGAAQLDLSRPGYTSVRDKAVRSDSFDGFSASGPINKEALDSFRELYSKQAQKATSVDSFGGTVMSDQALSIDAPAGDTNQ
jgi:hypothetical protein